jgi:hypothetical protein
MSSYSEYLAKLKGRITAGTLEDEHETKPASGYTETVKAISSAIRYSPNVQAVDAPGRRSYVNSASEIRSASVFTSDTKSDTVRISSGLSDIPASTARERIVKLFSYTGTLQTFIVPYGVTSVLLRIWGAGGGTCWDYGAGAPGGGGAYVEGVLRVYQNQRLSVLVGQGGPFITTGLTNAQVVSTFGGGGRGYVNGLNRGASGGGRSAIIDLSSGNELVTAGGGGGGANGVVPARVGGAGGISVGQLGASTIYTTTPTSVNGGGGSQEVGGTGGLVSSNVSVNGSKFAGGGRTSGFTGGGGGGGYYGGGSGTYAGAGGGGSSYIDNLNQTSASSAGNGQTPGNTTSSYVTSTIIGYGAPSPTSDTLPALAGNGLVVVEYDSAPAPLNLTFNEILERDPELSRIQSARNSYNVFANVVNRPPRGV